MPPVEDAAAFGRWRTSLLAFAASLLWAGCRSPLTVRSFADSGPGPAVAGDAAADADRCACPEPDRNGGVTLPLECWCTTGHCIETAQDFLSSDACANGLVLGGIEGCGRITIVSGGYDGSSMTFDEQSGRLVGVSQVNSLASGPCHANLYVYGEAPPVADSAPDAGQGLPCISVACAACARGSVSSCF